MAQQHKKGQVYEVLSKSISLCYNGNDAICPLEVDNTQKILNLALLVAYLMNLR